MTEAGVTYRSRAKHEFAANLMLSRGVISVIINEQSVTVGFGVVFVTVKLTVRRKNKAMET